MTDNMPAWALMWGLAVAVFSALKAWTWRAAAARGLRFAPSRAAGYLLLWPGMDPDPFSLGAPQAFPPAVAEWAWAVAKTAFGAGLFLLGPAAALRWGAAAAAWTGMVGLVFLLHFGLFHALSAAWRQAGVAAAPIMDAPHRSDSLADFWGRRWNRAFRDLAFGIVFKRAAGRLGPSNAVMASFLASGLVHDLVISLPAGGGWGLPTLYFLLQGAGLLAERRYGLGPRARRALALAVTAGPAYWLFHPPFIERVMLPFLRAAGAL